MNFKITIQRWNNDDRVRYSVWVYALVCIFRSLFLEVAIEIQQALRIIHRVFTQKLCALKYAANALISICVSSIDPTKRKGEIMSIKRKMVSILSVWLVAVTMLATTAHAAWTTLGVDIIRQEKSQWCWAASLEMCATYLGYTDYDQWDIVKEVKGTILNPYPDLPGNASNYRDGMEFATGNDYTASRTDTVFTINELDSFMDDMMPVIFAIGTYDENGDRSGHAVVCYAVDVSANKVKYRDPGYDNPITKYYPTFINSNNSSYCDGSAEIIQN